MRQKIKLSRIIFLALLISTFSCSDLNDDYELQKSTNEVKETFPFPLEGAVYHEPSDTWIAPREDPYTLDNFKNAYENLASGNSIQRYTSVELKNFTDKNQLKATHYALRIFPKNEDEQWKIELMEDVKVAYVPFNYVQISEEQINTLPISVQLKEIKYPERHRYSTTYEDYESTDGVPSSQKNNIMPILYVVWPHEKPLPNEFDYEFDYETFIPSYYSDYTQEIVDLNIKELQILEREAIYISTGLASLSNPTLDNNPISFITLTGRVVLNDTFLDKAVPQANLKQRFQYGSSIIDIYSQANGYFNLTTSPTITFYTYSNVFQHQQWKITTENSTSPFSKSWGIVFDHWQNDYSQQPRFSAALSIPAYQIHPAVNYFYNGSHSIIKWYSDSGTRIIAMDRSGDIGSGLFHYSKNSPPYIEIFNGNRTMTNMIASTTLHELGHFVHYSERGGYNNFKQVHKMIMESYALYVEWHVGNKYYESLGYNQTYITSDDATGSNQQGWTHSDPTVYTPLFIDLVDDYNQKTIMYSSLNYDPIKNVPHSLIRDIAANCADWNSMRSKLQQQQEIHYTFNEFIAFTLPYDIWFLLN